MFVGRTGAAGLRRRLSSPSGFISVGLVVSLAVGSVAVALGQGASRLLMDLGDGASWLPTNPRGAVTLVDGASGRPTAEVQLAAGDDAELKVVERGGSVYVLDVTTGVLTRIDAATLKAPKAVSTGGSSVLAGCGQAFAVDSEAGVISVLDESTLEPVGAPIELGSPIVQSVVDGSCTVFSLLDDGTVVPISTDGTVGPSLRVADSGDAASLSVVDGAAFVVDEADPAVAPLTPDGVGDRIDLDLPAGDLEVPDAASGSLPVLAEDGTLAVVETGTGSVTKVKVPTPEGAELGAPVVNGGLLYVPDFSSGTALVVEIAAGSVKEAIDVTDGTTFDLFVDDGIVFANDPKSDRAVVVDDTGSVRNVTKFDEEVAQNASQPAQTPEKLTPIPQSPQEENESEFPSLVDNPAPGQSELPRLIDPPVAPPADPGPPSDAPAPPAQVPVPGPAGPPAPEQPPGPPPAPAPEPPPSPEPPPAPEPPVPPVPHDECPGIEGDQPVGTDCTPAPGQPVIGQVSAKDRVATVPFSPPSDGGQIVSYALRVIEGGAPQDVQQSGEHQFTATFADCATVKFVVDAIGTDGEATSSAPSAGTALCQAPGKVGNLRVTDRTSDSITIAWDAPSGTGPFSYEIRYGDGPKPTDKTSFTATGLTPDTAYDFRVVALGPAGPGPEATTSDRTKPPPKPAFVTIRECRDGKELPGGGHRAYYGESCSQGSPTGRTFQVLSGPYAGYEPLYRYTRDRDTDQGYMREYYLKPGAAPDGGWGGGDVIGYVGGGAGPQIKAHRWDYWDGSYSWKAWSFGTDWPGFQPGNNNRASVDPVFRAE